jgi:hypothetical protein
MERDNPHPLWRQERCELCKAGDYLNAGGDHYRWNDDAGDYELRRCSSPSAESVIAEQAHTIEAFSRSDYRWAEEYEKAADRITDLTQQIAELQKDKSRLDEADRLMITNGHPNNGYAVKYPGSGNEWHREKSLRHAIDSAEAAMSQTAKEQGE